MSNDEARREVKNTLTDIERIEKELQMKQLRILDPKHFEYDTEAAEALEIIKRIERRLAANFLDTKPQQNPPND